MNKTKFYHVSRALDLSKRYLEDAMKVENLPLTFQQRIAQLQHEMDGHELDQYREPLKAVTGEVLTKKQALEIVTNASGLGKWHIEEVTDADRTAAEFRDEWGYDVKDDQFKVYHVSRKVRNRDAIGLVGLICGPGICMVEYYSDRASWGEEGIIENDSLEGELSKTFEHE